MRCRQLFIIDLTGEGENDDLIREGENEDIRSADLVPGRNDHLQVEVDVVCVLRTLRTPTQFSQPPAQITSNMYNKYGLS